tara:strand:- start:44 stop:439 length:396 start_codon:yes stop_codon:yes gene_type:complete
MITITKETINSFDDVCEAGIVEAENTWKDKEESFPIAIKDLPICVEHKLYLLFKLGITAFDVILFLSPYDTKEDFDEAHLLPENTNLYHSPSYFVMHRIATSVHSNSLAAGALAKHLPEDQLDDFLTNAIV